MKSSLIVVFLRFLLEIKEQKHTYFYQLLQGSNDFQEITTQHDRTKLLTLTFNVDLSLSII